MVTEKELKAKLLKVVKELEIARKERDPRTYWQLIGEKKALGWVLNGPFFGDF